MRQLLWRLPLILILGALTAAQTVAQPPQAPTSPMPQNLSPPPAPTRPQPITVQAGTGILLPLAQPASTLMSADPGVARVQPASPTSLFLMGVAAGHTTVIAASEAGTAIAQYDVTVIGLAGGQPTPILGPGVAPGATALITPETAEQVQTAIHRLMPGGLSIRATAAGGRLVLTGAVASPAAAEQAEAIARGYAGERTVIVAQFAVLSSIQVNVRVRIAEIDRTVTRQLGFNWQALGNGGTWKFGTLTGAGAVANATATTVAGLLGSGTGQTTISGLPVSVISPLQPLNLAPYMGAPSAPYQVGGGLLGGQVGHQRDYRRAGR